MAVGTLSSNAFGLHAINPAMSIPLMEGYEKASQTFKDGAILKRDTGTLAVAGADNTADIVGVAAAPASGTVIEQLFREVNQQPETTDAR